MMAGCLTARRICRASYSRSSAGLRSSSLVSTRSAPAALGEDVVEALRCTAVLAVAAMKVRIACAGLRCPQGF
jgi:hypothetical protein